MKAVEYVFRAFISVNQKLSASLDYLLPQKIRKDGNISFLTEILPNHLRKHEVIYDLGSGSRPCVTIEQKKSLKLHVTGLDIDETELLLAPRGIYDRIIVADLCNFVGDSEADVVVCQATLEHVKDLAGALRALASCAKNGGRVLIFVPCRNAAFARFNLALPQSVKKKLLYYIFPLKAIGHDGFAAYYDRCTPTQVAEIANQYGLRVEEERTFWKSSYFYVFVPAYLIWRSYQAILYLIIGKDAAETFALVLRKEEN
jgi:2-polyprenyl-6-hydroxyphenyl methylase/3-demethylubiquinone-9 3-methyltransferase